MKKALSIMIVAVIAIMVAGCSDTQKAKSLAKKYLSKNSNDGKIEIVECGELMDYEFTDDYAKKMKLMDSKSFLVQAETEMNLSEIHKGEPEEKEHIELAKQLLDKAEKAKKEYNEMKVETYKIKRMNFTVRGNNALGNKVLQDVVLYFDNDLKHCDKSANDIAHNLVK